ncbi:hypothetical protein N7501_003030 [Penicillium viridicatum]|nr:hypothetical protein N7501_003030 [Penicillium viridicatum]
MPTIPDWVLDSKLETHFPPGSKYETVHTYYEQESLSQRPIKKSEHWQREKKIGDGGFGEVWLERCTKGSSHGHDVRAIKQMEVRRQVDYGHQQYERCFVKSFGWYQTESSLFIAMEYLELGDLQDYVLAQSQPLPEFEVQRIMSQILEGLDLMHENGYAHRDLKPNNILLRSCPPNDWWVKIADFGISKRIEDGLGKSTTMKGTFGYIAPELFGFTLKGTLYAVDIWAAGEIMFQILTKQPTFKHPGLVFNYVQTPNIFPSDRLLVNEVSQPGVEFVLSLMHPTPAGRISAKDALQHSWIDQPLPDNRQSAPLAYKEAHSTSSLDSVTGQLASWNTIKSPASPTASAPNSMIGKSASSNTIKPPEAFEAFIPKTEELKTSSLYTSANETVKFRPVQHERRKSANTVHTILPKTLEGHYGRVTSVAFSPDGKLVASGSTDQSVKVWNTITGAIHKTLEGHSRWVTSVAFSPDSKFVASGSRDSTVNVWNIQTGDIHRKLEGDMRESNSGYSQWVTSTAFSPDGVFLASGAEDITLWNTTTGEIQRMIDGYFKVVNSVAFSPDGILLASGSDDNTVKLWNTTTGDIHKRLDGHSAHINSVAFSPGGTLVASGAEDNTVKLWNTMTGAMHKTLEGHSGGVTSVAFSHNGKSVASGSDDSTVKLWNTKTGAVRKTLEGHSGWVTSVAFSPNGRLVASGSMDQTIRLWNAT